MNHYDLAKEFPEETTSEDWKTFLTTTEVQEWIKSEVGMVQESELKKLVKNISQSRSVGQAQVMSTLSKLTETKLSKSGPVFIYSYVPLNPEEAQATNTQEEVEDVFQK